MGSCFFSQIPHLPLEDEEVSFVAPSSLAFSDTKPCLLGLTTRSPSQAGLVPPPLYWLLLVLKLCPAGLAELNITKHMASVPVFGSLHDRERSRIKHLSLRWGMLSINQAQATKTVPPLGTQNTTTWALGLAPGKRSLWYWPGQFAGLQAELLGFDTPFVTCVSQSSHGKSISAIKRR